MPAKSALLERLALHAPHLPSKQIIPAFIYGTAWKKEATADLVYDALKNGFTGIDTACQPKHYREDLVGEGLRRVIADNRIKRSDVFVQTKFTQVDGQDLKRIPYDATRPLVEQVRQSVETSLRHLSVGGRPDNDSYLDSVVLHSPMPTIEETMDVWRTLESYVPHRILNLGISNVNMSTLKTLYEQATIKPSVVQNRFYPATRFDVGIRKFCSDKQIIYQTFWTLSGNPQLIRSKPVQSLSSQLGISKEAALYCLVLGLDNTVVLNGTTNKENMKADWQALSVAKDFATSQPSAWERVMADFKALIGQSER